MMTALCGRFQFPMSSSLSLIEFLIYCSIGAVISADVLEAHSLSLSLSISSLLPMTFCDVVIVCLHSASMLSHYFFSSIHILINSEESWQWVNHSTTSLEKAMAFVVAVVATITIQLKIMDCIVNLKSFLKSSNFFILFHMFHLFWR